MKPDISKIVERLIAIDAPRNCLDFPMHTIAWSQGLNTLAVIHRASQPGKVRTGFIPNTASLCELFKRYGQSEP